jgi:hypothetical protein
LLGEIAEPTFVSPETTTRDEAATAPVRVTLPANILEVLGRRLVESGRVPEGVVREEMRDEGAPDQPIIYTINYRGLWCEEETTWDWASWADEIYLITSAVTIENGQNIVRTERHPVAESETWYSDVDSDEARLGPVAACWQGNSDPVSLTVVVMEHDEGDPDAFKEEIDAAVKAAIAVASYFYPPAAWAALLESQIADAINWLLDTADDPIETQTVVNPRGLLDLYASQNRATYLGEGQQNTGLEYHFMTTHNGGGSTYIAGFEVLRDPPNLPEGPFL